LSSLAASRDRPQRGTPAGLRFFGYAVIALALMWADQRGGILDRIRYGLQAAAYPVQIALNSPAAALRCATRCARASCKGCAVRRWSARTRNCGGCATRYGVWPPNGCPPT
jgi:hypothetical protein